MKSSQESRTPSVLLHLLVRWGWSSHYHYPLHWAVLRPAWGSLQLFRAIKLNKMEPRCDHRAHSDHSVPSVPCPWFCSTLAPGVATAQLMTSTIYIHQHFIGHRNCSILIVDELELCFCGSTCFKLYIIHSYIWGKKYNI